MDLPPRERAVRGRRLLRANLIGAGEQPVVKDPEAVAILFDQMRRQADAAAVPAGTTIEWDFTDFEPWHLTLREGGSVAAAGRAPHADLVLRTSLQSWADLTAGRADPLRLLVTRRLRPEGRPAPPAAPRARLRVGDGATRRPPARGVTSPCGPAPPRCTVGCK